MSKKFIKKNIKLSLEFNEYISQNPRELNKIPRGAHIMITVKGDPVFNENSKSLVGNIGRKSKLIEAHKESGKWRILAAPRV